MTAEPTDPTYPTLPAVLLPYRRAAPDNQIVPWTATEGWAGVLQPCPQLLLDLDAEVEEYGGIRRVFVHERASGDPLALFLAAMAWGFGTTGYGATRVAKILSDPEATAKLGRIVSVVRTDGAAEGWGELLNPRRSKIPHLGMAFGTKLLYFAGYHAPTDGPRPLILDMFVRRSLERLSDTMPSPGSTIWRNHYLAYLDAAERWAADPQWNATPETVEFALFDLGKRSGENDAALIDDDSDAAPGDAP